MHISVEATGSPAAVKMFAREGCAAWSLPGPWHFSQPTFHSVGFLVRMSKLTEWQPSHSVLVGRVVLPPG